MSTLGYKDHERYRKVDIAKIQLEEAIRLFVREKFICSLTLAGAAEEIFAGFLRTKGESPAVEKAIAKIVEIRNGIGVSAMGGRNRKEIICQWNFAKNKSKHHDPDDDEYIAFNECDEAYWMIKRALSNAKECSVPISNEHEFENWVISRVCL